MPVVELNENNVLPERSNYDMQIERDPTFKELAGAYFENENLIYNVANKFAMPTFEPDPEYDVFADLRVTNDRYAGYLDRFIGVENPLHAKWVMDNIDRELENKSVMASGGLEGVAAGFLVGMSDPTMLIPIGGAAYKTYRTGGRILEGAARTALATGTVVGASELALQSLQETRTAEESMWNIAGATFLSGVVGGAASAFGGQRQLAELGQRVDDELRVPRDPYDMGSAGAMATPTTSLSDEALKSAVGLEKLLSFQDPLLRMANSPSKAARTSMEQLAELSLVKNKNTQGIASPVSVENRIKSYETNKYLYLKERDALFLKYRQSQSKIAVNLKDTLTDAGDRVFRRSRQDGKLTYQEFKEAITMAGRRDDTHEIPEVAEAARKKRQMVIDPIFNEAKAVGLIDPDTEAPKTAQSYVNRLWDHAAIKANRKEFEDVNTKWLIEKRDKAAADLQATFEEFNLDTNQRVAAAVRSEREAFRAAQKDTREAVRKEAKAGDKVERLRISIDELDTRLRDATKNQERIYNKILNKRERGDEDLRDLFNEFRSVSSAKRDLYKSLMAKESDNETATKGFWRREQIANALEEAERQMEERLAKLEKQIGLMEDLEYKASFDDGDLGSVSYKLTDRILGTSVGRLSYDNKIKTGAAGGRGAKRGPAKARVYDIPDAMVEKFLVNDDDMLLESYVKSLASDIELTRTFGSVDPEDALKAIQDDYELLERALVKEAKEKGETVDAKTLEKLREAKNRDLADFQAVWERLRGTYGNNGDDYASGWRSAERALMNVNYLSMLGGMTISAFTDVARPVMVHGINRVMGDGIAAMALDWKSFKAAAMDVKEAGTAWDMVSNTRAKALFGLDEFMPFQNKAEAVTGAMAQNFGVISLMAPWNAGMKQFAGVMTQTRMLRSIRKLAEGKDIPQAEIEYLAANFIDKDTAKAIAKQFDEFGTESDKVLIPNARDWTDRRAQDTFRAAIRKEVDRIIVTPGQDKPLWMSKSGWRLMGQFRSFSVASTQRTMLSGLQQRDMAVLNGALMSVFLGSMSYVVKANIAGYEPDYSAANLIREGVDRSGLLAWLTDANNVVEKVSRGRIGISALMGGPPMSRYASRSALEAVFGPSYGMAGNLVQITGNAFAGDWQASDTRTVRRMMPYNNLFYVRSLFDEAEANINEFFGVKGRR